MVTGLLAVALLVTLTLAPAQADQDTDPVGDLLGQVMSVADAKAALATALAFFEDDKDSTARRGRAADLAHGRAATMVLRDVWRASQVLRGEDRETAQRLLARPSDGLGDDLGWLGRFQLSANHSLDCETSSRFCVHYVTSGKHAATPAFAASVARTLDAVHTTFVSRLGYRKPVSDAGWAGGGGILTNAKSNPDGKFDVFLGDLGDMGIYGYCTLDPEESSSYCALDNDFSRLQYGNTPINSLRATAAHEYFHAVQFAYDATEDSWLMEGSAVWAEEQAYDAVNDYLQYVRGDSVITNSYPPVDEDSVHNLRVYSAMLFFEHLTQTLGVTRMRDVWEAAAGAHYSLQAVQAVVSRHTSWSGFINRFAVWNSRPPGVGYAERNLYPGGHFTVSKRLGLNTTRTLKTAAMKRDHLSSGSILLIPAKASTKSQRIRISINGPDTARGAVASIQRRLPNKTTEVRVVHLNASGDATLLQPFGKGRISQIVLTFANASTRMNNCGAYYGTPVSYSCGGKGAYNDAWRVSATVVR